MPSEVRLSDVRKLLKRHGWTLDRISGSHHVFVKEGEANLTFPVHRGRVQPVYLRKIEKAVGERLR